VPPIPRNPNIAQRKVYFHRLEPRHDPPDQFVLDRSAVVAGVERLRGGPNFYLPEGAPEDEQRLCAVVDDVGEPQRLRFYRVRRRNLPETEVEGDFAALELDERRGLAESIHVVLFSDNVVGSEYNHYGPRASTLATFLNERCQQDVVMRQLVRRDVMTAILNMREIRKIRIKAAPAAAAVLRDRASGLGGAVDAAENFSAGKYLDLTLAPDTGHTREFTEQAKAFFRRVRDRNAPSDLEAAEVDGITDEGLVGHLDLLHDYVVLNREIERESPRSRALDRDAAYRAIQDAYQEIEGEIGEGGTITVAG
jgi:hypothetical protein